MDTKKMGPRPPPGQSSTRKSGARWSLPITSFLLFLAAQQSATLEGQPPTGRIILVGGWKANGIPSTLNSEVLFGPELPPFPDAVFLNTLSRVGGSVYSCGGIDSSRKPSNKCWVIDTVTEGATWRSFDIPWAMYSHGAVVVQDEIWLFNYGKLRILDTRNPANEPREISLGFGFSAEPCTVTHGSKTFVVGAGLRDNEVHVNSDPSKPQKWEIFSTLMQPRSNFACHVFKGEVFVTGGRFSEGPSYKQTFVEAISLVDGTVRSLGPLGRRREGHMMAIIEGRLAMLGGRNRTHPMANIETYDEQTNSWKTLGRTLAEPRIFFGLTQFRL